MKKWIKISCQDKCPIGKKCSFGEVKAGSVRELKPIERHKCKFSKSTGKEYVEVVVG